MFEIKIGDKACKAEVSFYTAQLYEAEFKADLIKDFYGKQDVSEPPIGLDGKGERVVSIDFTRVDWLALTRVMWAAIKTADAKAPGYAAWMRSVKGVNLWDFQREVDAEIADCFFRAEAPGEKAEGEQ